MRLAKDLELREIAGGLIVGALALLLSSAALRSGLDFRLLKKRSHVEHGLSETATRIDREIARTYTELAATAIRDSSRRTGAAETLAGEHYAVWRSDGERVELLASREPLEPEYLVELFEDAELTVLDLVPTPDGRGALLLRTPLDAERGWIGVSIDAVSLWAASGLLDFVKAGVDVAITSESGQRIYRSSPLELDRPVAARVELPGGAWEFRAAPVDGWSGERVSWWIGLLAAIVIFGYAVSYMLLLRRPRVLAAERQTLERQLRNSDEEVASLLRDRAELEAQIRRLLAVDPHTGLPNRTSLVEHVDAKLAERRLSAADGVLLATVHFRELETFGHSFGAQAAHKLVSEAADRLQLAYGSKYLLARTGSRELTLCLPLNDANRGPDVAAKLLETVHEQFIVDDRRVYSNAVVGIAQSRDGYALGSELVDHAALAAEDAAALPDRWCVFHEEAQRQRAGRLRLEADLANALPNNELRLAFQPIVSMTAGTIVGFEALLRWQHPTAPLILPDRFIQLAEGIGLMRHISDWVVREGIAHSKQWLPLRADPVYVSVNLRPGDLNRAFCDQVFDLLREVAVPAEGICVEVTETAVVRDFRTAARLINELNERGVRVLLDDFGTGYSSLSCLRELPFHAVKLDRSFVQRIGHDSRDFGLVRSVVSLVHYLGMECVAEGVETQEQCDLLAMVNCDYGQGYFYSKPMAAVEVQHLLMDRPLQKQATGER